MSVYSENRRRRRTNVWKNIDHYTVVLLRGSCYCGNLSMSFRVCLNGFDAMEPNWQFTFRF
jgi:hypothetical protein